MLFVRQSDCKITVPFHFVAVTKSNDFIQAKQDEPYGDIILTRGPYL